MANWSNPSLSDGYASYLQALKDRDVDLIVMFEGTTPQNVPANAKRWNASANRFEKWDGVSAWVQLTTTFAMNVSSVGGYVPGNASGQVPVSNGTVNTNLNADMVDGSHAGTSANNVLRLDGSARIPAASIPPTTVTAGTYRSLTVGADGRVTAGTNPTTRDGYGISDVPKVDGTGASGTWGISISGNAATASSATTATTATSATTASSATTSTRASYSNALVQWDGTTPSAPSSTIATSGGRGVNLAPNAFVRGIFFEFKNASLFSTLGNYSGLLTIAPYDGTTSSTGDVNYQLRFSPSGTNNTANPTLALRAGVDTTWGAWVTLLHSGNYNTFAPTLTGTGASGTWGISISGNAATATSATSATSAASANAVADGANVGNLYNQGGWYRSVGQVGWFSQTYGVGVYATDTSWVRVYGNAGLYVGSGVVRSDQGLQVGSSGASFDVTSAGAVAAAGAITAQGLLFGRGSTKGFGRITTTTTTGTPTGGASGDFVFVY